MKKNHMLLFTIALMFQQSLLSQIDPEVPVNWANVGYGGKYYPIPRSFVVLVNMKTEKLAIPDDGLDDTEEINAAIRDKIENSPDVMTIFYFPAGVYSLDSSINIPDGAKNILFLGAGSNYTKFEVRRAVSGFRIYHNAQSPWIDLTTHSSRTSLLENHSTIYVPTEMPVQNGDYIEIAVKMGSWLGKYKSTNPLRNNESVNDYQVGQIAKVDFHFSFPMIVLYDVLRMDFSDATLNPRIRKINTVSDIGFENFTIENTCVIPESEIQDDEGDNHLNIHNFDFSYATDCWMWGVESIDPLNSHVSIGNSSYIEIRGCYFHEAKGYGGGGHGYGVSIGNHATNCLVEDNIFDQLRHAMIISRGANGNVFGYNYSNEIVYEDDLDQGDISIHGNYPFANLFEGNIARFACADKYWGANGHKNTLFRNRFTKMPNFPPFDVNTICLASRVEYNGGIRIEDMTEVQQSLHVVGNVVRWGTCLDGIRRAQYLPEDLPTKAVAVNLNNAKFNPDNYDDILEDAGFGIDRGISYYLFAKPSFLGEISFPPVGCKHVFAIDPDGTERERAPGQNIPALIRFSDAVKTLSSSPIINLYSLTLKNDLDGTENVGSVGAWQKNNAGSMAWSSYPSPATIYLQPNPSQNIRAESDMLSHSSRTWGHNYWFDNSSLISTERTINLNSNQSYSALFKKSYPMTLASQLPEAGVQGEVVFRGQTFNSPLDKYGFESPLETPIGVPATKTVNNVNYNFVNWDDGSTSAIRNVSLSGSTTFTANYKGHRYSTSSNAIANNNQRKIAQSSNGTYFMVYSSMNKIWLTKSADGVNWSNEEEVSVGTWFPIDKSPSIAVYNDKAIIVWQGTDDWYGGFTTSSIYCRTFNISTNNWDQNEEVSVFTPPYLGFDATPVVDICTYINKGDPTTYEQIVVVWKETSRLAISKKDSFYGNSWTIPYTITGTNSDCYHPSIVWNRSDASFAICWEDRSTESIEYTEAYNYTAWVIPAAFQVSQSGWYGNQRPTIAVTNDKRRVVVWQSHDNVVEGTSVHVREKSNDGAWSVTPTSFSTNTPSIPKPVVGTYSANNKYTVAWEVDGNIYSAKFNGSSWASPTLIASGSSGGADLSTINYSSSTLFGLWRKGSGSIPVTSSGFHQGQQQQKSDNSEIKALAYRLNRHALFNLESDTTLASKGYKGMIAFEVAALGMQTPEATSDVKVAKEGRRLKSDKIAVNANSNGLKFAGAYYAKGLEIPKDAKLNELNTLVRLQLKDANTDEVIKDIWSIPFARFTNTEILTSDSVQGKTDGEYRTMNIPLNGLKGREVYLDVTTPEGFEPIFVDDYYMFDGEDEKMKKFFAEPVAMPTEYALHQNYPNPFNPSTTIRFDLVEPQYVTMKIYNLLGQQVRELVDEYYSAGSHEVTLKASSLSSGAYFYRMTAGEFSAVKSFMLVK